MYVSEYYSKDRVYSDLFIDNMIYMKQWGGLNRNSLSINVQFPPYFSLYILSIDLLNKCQWHLILYILLLVLGSYNIMNHYLLVFV